MPPASLSADHRVFYGATGAQFLADVKSKLEKPLSLVL
ncbi:MAG: 2-oxo acid dehydrogenase subunit E2 [Chloroflexota bacterium]|nr:2-oxo acid dehydrogenase subunit E2 [Chloroflexota bacterium]